MKWLGACLAAAACIALGFGLAGALNARVRALGDAIRALRMLSHRIVMLSEPQREAMEALQEESALFARVLRHLQVDAETAWKRALTNTLELSKGDAAVIEGMMAESGGGGRAEQEHIFAVGIERLSEHERQASVKAKTDAKLYRTLGMLAAAMMLLITL